MKYKCLEIIFSIMLLKPNNASKYDEVYIGTACQHNSTIVIGLGTSTNSAVIIKNNKEHGYGAHNDCNITISTNSIKNGHVMLSIRRIDFDDPDSCQNYVEIFNGRTFMDKICGNFDYTTSLVSFNIPKEDFAKFHYHTVNSSSSHSGFEIVATAYTDGPCKGNFNLQCSNNICISYSLKCDGYNNCGDRSDERTCYPPPQGSKNAVIVAVAIVVVVLVVLAIVIIWKCRYQGEENIRIIPNGGYQSMALRNTQGFSSSFPVFDTSF